MKKILLAVAVMFATAFISCTGSSDASTATTDSIEVADSVMTDSIAVDSVVVADSIVADSVM